VVKGSSGGGLPSASCGVCRRTLAFWGLIEVDVGDHLSPLPKNDLQKEHPKSEVHRRSRIMLGMRKTFWIVIVVSVFLGGCEGPHVWDYQILMPQGS